MWFLSILFCIGAQAENLFLKGDLYEENSGRQKKLYTQENFRSQVGETETIRAEFKSLEGNLVVLEKSTLINGELHRIEVEQKQENQLGLIEINGDQISFSKTENGKTTVKTEKLKRPVLNSASMTNYIQKNWTDLENKKELEFRYAVWFRQETVGFSLKKERQEESPQGAISVYKLSPSSFVIRALVKPVFLYVNHSKKQIITVKGRVSPKLKDGDRWKDLDAEAVFQYLD